MSEQSSGAVEAFIVAASVPRDDWHANGTLDAANQLLARDPAIASRNVVTAAILGDGPAVRRVLAADPAAATRASGPFQWAPLTYLAFSRYLKLDRSRSAGFVDAATALLDAGADPNGGWWDEGHEPQPEWESVLYGAAGLAHHPELTRLLLARGGDPNDNETPYHAAETYDNAALIELLESGKLSADSLATLLLRKADWHDHDGMTILLASGVNPNVFGTWPITPFHQALNRDNAIANVRLLLDHGADPHLGDKRNGFTALSIAVRRGRADVLEEFERRGVSLSIDGVERLIAACVRDDAPAIETIRQHEPALVRELLAIGPTLLAEFAGTANTAGVRNLLRLGVPIDARYGGDGYFDIAPDSTALHVAAWKAWHETVRFLVEHGAAIDARDGRGRTPLSLAVRACVDSHWTRRRRPDSVEVLLEAGASVEGVPYPCGYDAVDVLLGQRRRSPEEAPGDRRRMG